jgi:hypothetical protein
MHISSRFTRAFGLLTALSGVTAVQAQEGAPKPATVAGTAAPAANGFDSLLEAIEGYEGAQRDGVGLPPADLLKFQRNNVARGTRSLKKIREALAMPIRHPKVRNLDEDFGFYKDFRVMALLLKQDAAVRASTADWIGAVNSDLDCIQMGIAITRGGPLRASVFGREIERLGRTGIDPLIRGLTSAECRTVAARLGQIEALRPNYSEALIEEKETALALTKDAFETRDWNDSIAEAKKLNGQPFTQEEKDDLANIGESEVLENLANILDEILKSAEMPYRPAKPGALRARDPWSRMTTETVTSTSYRVDYEGSRAQNLLLQKALELRAAKMETGKYPETIDLPNDPFSSENKLKYRLAGDSYLLYSVGPDAKDNDGAPVEISAEGIIAPKATGDLLAPVFSQ